MTKQDTTSKIDIPELLSNNSMDWQQESILLGPTTMDKRMSKNTENLQILSQMCWEIFGIREIETFSFEDKPWRHIWLLEAMFPKLWLLRAVHVNRRRNIQRVLRCVIVMTAIIIIIITSYRKHVYPRLSLATSPYSSSSLAVLQGYILYPHRAAVCMFELVVLLLLGHMWGSIGVHHLWARPCFSSSVLNV